MARNKNPKNRRPKHTFYQPGARIIVTFNDDNAVLIVDKVQETTTKELVLRHYGKFLWSKIRLVNYFNPARDMPRLREKKLLLTKDGYSIGLEVFNADNVDLHNMFLAERGVSLDDPPGTAAKAIREGARRNAEKLNQETTQMTKKNRKSQAASEQQWREVCSDMKNGLSTRESQRKSGVSHTTLGRMRQILTDRKPIGFHGLRPPGDVAAQIPVEPKGQHVRSSVADQITAAADAARVINDAAPVKFARMTRITVDGRIIRHIAERLFTVTDDALAEELNISNSSTNRWKQKLRGHLEIGPRELRRIPQDILDAIPLTSNYVTPKMEWSEPDENGSQTVTVTRTIQEFGAVADQSVVTLAKGGGIIKRLVRIQELLLSAAENVDNQIAHVRAIRAAREIATDSESLLQEYTTLMKEVDELL